jgi:dTDP-glucose pyrophosphorylase
MNILIPMAGLGSRFPKSKLPKPLIDVNGKPMVQRAVESMGIDGNLIFIIRSEHNVEFNLDEKIKDLFPESTIISVDYLTEGPACTAILAKNIIDKDEPLIIANCDQIMNWDHETFSLFCKNYPHDGFVVTYFANTEKNSYVKIQNNGFAKELKEKEIISNISTNGIHFWKKGSDFVQSVYDMIENNDRAPNGEFYIAPSYNYLINKNKKIGIFHIPNCQHWAVGTEEDLDIYIRSDND